jgi:hypothetical protein
VFPLAVAVSVLIPGVPVKFRFNVPVAAFVKALLPDNPVVMVNVLLFVVGELTVIVPLTPVTPSTVAVPEPLTVRLL